MEENILKLVIEMNTMFYPKKSRRIESGEFGIIKAKVIKRLDGTEYNDDYIKLKGIFCEMVYLQEYKVYCKLAESNPKYGDTYEVTFINPNVELNNREQQKNFLKNFVNSNAVDKLFDAYDDVISILENKDMDKLCAVKGIRKPVARKILSSYEDSKDYSQIYIELDNVGLTHNMIGKLMAHYKSPQTVIDVVKNRPYDMVSIDGIGFKTADNIALKAGVELFDEYRICGFMEYILEESAELGKSYLYYTDLISSVYNTIGNVPNDVLVKVATKLIAENKIVLRDNNTKVFLKKYYELEMNIYKELLRLYIGYTPTDEPVYEYHPKPFVISDVEEKIKDIEKKQGFEFTDEQKDFIYKGINKNVIALTGGAGCGKSSTANAITSLFKNRLITCVALSGKASVRITEATGLPAQTIHMALGYEFGGFVYNRNNKLQTDIVIIDEATMINGTLFLQLLESIPTGAKVIIMGDVQQLTPIGNCQVFADILKSKVIDVVKLTKPHRQALRSGIIPTSIDVANNKQIFDSDFVGNTIVGELQDMEFDIFNDGDIVDSVVEHFKKEMKKWDNNIMNVQITTPMKSRGDVSCFNLNTIIQSIYNPIDEWHSGEEVFDVPIAKDKVYHIHVGDKVINTKNNYKTVDIYDNEVPIKNGNIGIITEMSDSGCVVDFENIGKIVLSKSEMKNLELGYAISVHKCQGSGFISTIVAMNNGSYLMNNCELLYTALTRAIKYCVLVAENKTIRMAISKHETNNKQTILSDILIENKNKFK